MAYGGVVLQRFVFIKVCMGENAFEFIAKYNTWVGTLIARKCFILPAECSPEKSLILFEILPAELIQAYTSHTPPDPFSLGHSPVPLHRINQTASKAKSFQINIHSVPSARKKKKTFLGTKLPERLLHLCLFRERNRGNLPRFSC